MRQLRLWLSFPVCKIMRMCTRATTGISVLILTHFRAWKAKSCRHMRRLVRTFSTPFYKVWMSRREDPSGIFNMLFIETAIDFFLFFFHYYFSFRPVEIYLYFVVCTREFGKRPLLKIFSLKKCAKYETCAKCAEYETCAICTGLICCNFFETIFFLKFEINEYSNIFIFFGG